MSSRDLLNRLPSVFNKAAANGMRCTIQFISAETTYLQVADDTCQVVHGRAEKPDLVVTISDPHLVDLLKGKLNPPVALMLRKLKAEGDLDLGMRLTSLFDFKKL